MTKSNAKNLPKSKPSKLCPVYMPECSLICQVIKPLQRDMSLPRRRPTGPQTDRRAHWSCFVFCVAWPLDQCQSTLPSCYLYQ